MIGQLGVTSIFVTHDQDEAIEVADEIIVTNKGRIEQVGTPIAVYQNPETAFTAGFFGQTTVLRNYEDFKTFDRVEGADQAIVRPEFIRITKKDEEQPFSTSAVEGVVERTSFRGDALEVQVKARGNLFTARRGLDEPLVEAGEKVDLFIYRIFVTVGDKAVLVENRALREDPVII